MPLTQRRSVQGSAQQAHADAASAAAVSFLIGGSAFNEACDILLEQQSSQSSASSCPQTEGQNRNNIDHSQKLAALYQKGKAAYNMICRADDTSSVFSSDIMSIMTPGNLAVASSSAGNSSQASLSAAANNNAPLPRSRGSFTSSTPHGNKSKMTTPGLLIHRKRSSLEGGGFSRSLSDTSDVSNNSSTPGSGNNNTNRGGGKSASNISAVKKQQQQKPKKADPPPEVLNFLKALNAGGSTATAPASTPPPSSSTTTTAAATTNNNDDDDNATNSRKRPSVSTRKRPPPPPPPRRQQSRSSTDADDEHDESNNDKETTTTTTTTKRSTRSTRRGASSTNGKNTRVYDIGESVFVQVDGKHYNAIVKNVDFKAEEDDQEDMGDDNDTMGQVRAVYEVEFSDGEVMEDVGGDDVHSADEEE